MFKLKEIITLFSILFFTNNYSQSGCNFSSEDFNMYMCLENYSGYTSSIKSQSIVKEILNKVGISDANFILKTCDNTKNATAVFWNNKRYIILDENFLNSIIKNEQYWFYLFVLSHEIGHHLYGHMFEKSNLEKSRLEELQADKFAGLVIRKFGGNINNIKKALQSIKHPQYNNSSHPILNDRINASITGYNSEIKEEKEVLNKYNVITEKEYLSFQKAKQIENARIQGVNYLLNNTTDNLEKAIKLYNIAIVDYEDQDLYSELSSLYALNSELYYAETFAQKAYKTKNNPEFLILSWEICFDNKNNDCNKYEQNIKSLNYEKIKNSNILKILAKFYANVTDDKYNIDNLKITEKLLLTAKINIEQNNKPSDEDNLLLLDIFHDLSVTYLRLENYKEAYFYLKKALSNKENLMYDNNKIDKISNLNICILYSNKALIEMRLEMWEECIRSCDKLIQINPTFENVLNGSCNYYKGRSYHSMKKYKDAILSYNKAIRSTANNFGFLYYYRGITKYALNDIENACIDFKIGCDNGIESSCNRYNNLCNK